MTEADEIPESVQCLAWITAGFLRQGTGELVVTPGVVRLRTPGLIGFFAGTSGFEKSDGDIAIDYLRLRFPWGSAVVSLNRDLTAAVPRKAARKASRILSASGFRVIEHHGWRRSRAVLEGQVRRLSS